MPFESWMEELKRLADKQDVDLKLELGLRYHSYHSYGWSPEQTVDDVEIQGMELHKCPPCQFCGGLLNDHKGHCPVNNQGEA